MKSMVITVRIDPDTLAHGLEGISLRPDITQPVKLSTLARLLIQAGVSHFASPAWLAGTEPSPLAKQALQAMTTQGKKVTLASSLQSLRQSGLGKQAPVSVVSKSSSVALDLLSHTEQTQAKSIIAGLKADAWDITEPGDFHMDKDDTTMRLLVYVVWTMHREELTPEMTEHIHTCYDYYWKADEEEGEGHE